MRTPLALLLSILSLLLTGCGSDARADVVERIDGITAESCEARLRELVAIGPRSAGDEAATRATLDYLTRQLESYGYAVTVEPVGMEVGGVEQVNLLAELTGTVEPDVVVELGAHYDTVRRSPGADDNGSGVVGVLEAARVLADYRPRRTIRFCLFAAEELGLHGSRAHVRRAVADDARSVEGILVLEMIGFASMEEDSQDAPLRIPVIASLPSTGDFILVAGNMSSGYLGNVFEGCVDRYVPDLAYYSANRIAGFFGDAARSDHLPYWEAGLAGIMITDTANFRNPHYHRRTDTMETIDHLFMSRVVRAAAASLMEWSN